MKTKQKNIFQLISIVLSVIFILPLACCQSKNKNAMPNIQFIPKEFHEVKLGLDEKDIYPITPNYPEPFLVMLNEIEIFSPDTIICNPKQENFVPIIPICGYYVITLRRGGKFYNEKNLIHIKRLKDDKWISAELIELHENEHPALPPNYEEAERERQERIKEAQKYSDEELDEGQAEATALNINVMKYISYPIVPGKYEVFVSKAGLESNHVFVEIIFEE